MSDEGCYEPGTEPCVILGDFSVRHNHLSATSSEHADLIAQIEGRREFYGDQYEEGSEVDLMFKAAAALASTPSPAQPTEANEGEALSGLHFAHSTESAQLTEADKPRYEGGHYTMCNVPNAGGCFTPWCTCPCHQWVAPEPEHAVVAPSPVQGADDRMAQAEVLLAHRSHWYGGGSIGWGLHCICGELLELGGSSVPSGVEVGDYRLAQHQLGILATYQQSPRAALNEVRAQALVEASWAHMQDTSNPAEVRDMLRARAAELRADSQTRDERG